MRTATLWLSATAAGLACTIAPMHNLWQELLVLVGFVLLVFPAASAVERHMPYAPPRH